MSAGNVLTKSYVVRSVDEAMGHARRDLGPDALLLNSRRIAGENGQPGGYEVVFSAPAPAAPASATPLRRPVVRRPAVVEDNHSGELEKLHAQIDEIRALLMRSSAARISVGRTVPELTDVYARLISCEVDHALSKDIVDRLEADMATDAFFQRPGSGRESAANRWKSLRFDPARLEMFLTAELQRRVSIDSRLHSVVALVGPTGAGKTTSIMKLAASDITAGRPVRILSLDTSRAAGQLQLQAFASNLKIRFAVVPSARDLPRLVEEAQAANTGAKEFILIDTPGYFGPDGRGSEVAADALARCPELDVHLVAPGYMKASDLRLCIQKYGVFQPSKLLVTKLDETQAFGSVFTEAAYAGLPLSFLAHGPAIPDHIRPAGLDDLLFLALDRRRTRAHCA